MKVLWLTVIALTYAFKVSLELNYDELVHAEPCVMLVKRKCPYSRAAIHLLEDRGVRCRIIEVDGNREAYHFAKAHHKTFPTLFYEGHVVEGGYAELEHRAKEGLAPFQKYRGGTYFVGDKHLVVSKLKD